MDWIGYLIAGITLLAYALLVAGCRYGWHRLQGKVQLHHPLMISMLIPFRNEAEALPHLAEQLSRIRFPSDRLEILFVDDHSEDNSVALLEEIIPRIPFACRIIRVPDSCTGKRAALRTGMDHARFAHILTTDADCRMNPEWISSMEAGYDDSCRLVCAPVKIAPAVSFFHKLQQLDLMPVMAVTAGLAGIGLPVMANGAGMLFLREDFSRYLSTGYHPGDTGDDTWFLLWMKKTFPGSVRFSPQQGSIVESLPVASPGDFFRQRQRWAYKSRNYRDATLLITLGLIAWTNLLLPILFVLACFSSVWLLPALMLLGGKFFLDLVLLLPVLRFFKALDLLLWVPLIELGYPLYTLAVGQLIFRKNYEWKGRTYS